MPEKNNHSFEGTSLSPSMEDYVETIELLSREKKVVRVKDIAKNLNIKMPSVTAALQKLEEMGLINYERYGFIDLTDNGKKIAEKVYSRHSFLDEFFHNVLRIEKKRAEEVACKVEHCLTPEACRQVYKLLEFYKSEKLKDDEWVGRLNNILEERKLSELQEGDVCVIVQITGEGPFKKRLSEMGFRKGERMKIIKYAPLKDPVEISIKGYNISLRVSEASEILVKQVVD